MCVYCDENEKNDYLIRDNKLHAVLKIRPWDKTIQIVTVVDCPECTETMAIKARFPINYCPHCGRQLGSEANDGIIPTGTN